MGGLAAGDRLPVTRTSDDSPILTAAFATRETFANAGTWTSIPWRAKRPGMPTAGDDTSRTNWRHSWEDDDQMSVRGEEPSCRPI